MPPTSVKFSIKNYLPLLLIVLGFIIAKLSQLSLPHYWDEAWSYATAVQKMYEQGPTLLPGIVDVDATRGHPLFFYAAASAWMKIFGASLVSKHSFALCVSVLLLIAIYEFCYKLYNLRVAIISTLLFGSQIFFFVQSSMLLPEVMVTLFILTSIYFFNAEKYIALAVSLTLLFLTKESGLVLGIILGIAFIVSLFNSRYSSQQKIRLFAALLFPALVIAGFFILQKSIYGWYFFPEHIGLVDANFNDLRSKFRSSLSIVFLEEKRKWLWMMIAVLAALYAIRKKHYRGNQPSSTPKQKRFVVLFAAFCIAYLIFCSLNFYTARYLMPVLLFSLILFTIWLDRLIRAIDLRLYLPFAMIVMAVSIQSYLKNKSIGDTSLGSYSALKVQQAAINYLADQHAQKDQIGTGSFLQTVNMQNPACGFIKGPNQPFKNVRWDIDSSTHYVLFDNIEPDSRYEKIKGDSDYQLVYRVKKGIVWAEVYRRK